MKRFQQMSWLVLGLIVALSIAGCNSSNPTQISSSPTMPTVQAGSFPQLVNCWGGRGIGGYGVMLLGEQFEISTPAGTYILTYSIVNGGTFHIVFTSEQSAFLAIGLLPGDVLSKITIQPGELPENTELENENGGVMFTVVPVNATFDLSSIFIASVTILPIMLVENGEIAESEEGGVVIEESTGRQTISVTVIGDGTVSPSATEIERPRGSSQMFKFKDYAHLEHVYIFKGTDKEVDALEDLDDAEALDKLDTLADSATDVLGSVKELGNGDGQLVIHGIMEDLHMVVVFELATPAP